jgi:hypothetical protein
MILGKIATNLGVSFEVMLVVSLLNVVVEFLKVYGC